MAIWYEDAEVTISSSSQTIELEHTGFGIYRDVNDELHIETLGEYFLEVKRPGGLIYTDSEDS